MTRRALIVHPSNEWYGADQMLFVWARQLRERGWDVTVALPTDVDYDGELGRRLTEIECQVLDLELPILRRRDLTPRRIGGLLRRLGRSFLWVRRTSRTMDAVLFSTAATALSMPATVGLRARRAVHVQESFRSGAQAAILSRVISWTCDDIVACSRAVREAMEGPAARRCQVIYNGLDDVPLPDRSPSVPPIVLLVARVQSWKGQDMAIRMLAEPCLRDHPSAPVLRLVGAEPPGEVGQHVPRLEKLAHELRVADRVEFLGQRSDVPQLIAEASVVLNVSQRPDPFPLSTLEAMRAGATVVAGRLGGLPEMLGDAGLLAEPHSAQGLAKQVSAALDDRDKAESLGRAARKRWDERYSSRAHAARLDVLFSDWEG